MNVETLGHAGQIYNRTNAQDIKKSYDLKSESSFNSVLDVNPNTNDAALPDEASKASDRWTDVSLYTFDSSPKGYTVSEDALLRVKEHLESESIDADQRTPTHKITDEQMEWLNSKYDLHHLSVCSISEAEFGNFMLDLAYLNVFSLDEVRNMYAGIIPPQSDQPQLISLYYHGAPETGEGAGYVDLNAEGTVVNEDVPTDHITANYLKAEKPGLTSEEYREMTTEFSAQFQERLKILKNIFGFLADSIESATDTTLLKIYDVSEKLKEDFGNRL